MASNETAALSVGTRVHLNAATGESEATRAQVAEIVEYVGNIGGVRVHPPLAGCWVWNVADLEVADAE